MKNRCRQIRVARGKEARPGFVFLLYQCSFPPSPFCIKQLPVSLHPSGTSALIPCHCPCMAMSTALHRLSQAPEQHISAKGGMLSYTSSCQGFWQQVQDVANGPKISAIYVGMPYSLRCYGFVPGAISKYIVLHRKCDPPKATTSKKFAQCFFFSVMVRHGLYCRTKQVRLNCAGRGANRHIEWID